MSDDPAMLKMLGAAGQWCADNPDATTDRRAVEIARERLAARYDWADDSGCAIECELIARHLASLATAVVVERYLS